MLKKSQKIIEIEPRYILPGQNSARHSFSEYELLLLRDSIESMGILSPLTVRELSGGRYTVISGERRLIAARMAGLKKVPCIVENFDEEMSRLFSVSELLTTEMPDFFEVAEAIEKLRVNSGLSVGEAAAMLGISETVLAKKQRVLRLSDTLKSRITSAKLSEGHALALTKLPPEKREEALLKIIADDMGVNATERLINEMQTEKNEKPVRRAALGSIKILGNSLKKIVNTANSAGYHTEIDVREDENEVEYIVSVSKHREEPEYCQLPIC